MSKTVELFFRKIGDVGPHVVILHGVFGSADNWMTIQRTIAQSGFQVWALDARNHGQSPWSNEFSYEAMADDLKAFLVQHQIQQPIIIGHSMGGKVLMQFAMHHSAMSSKMMVVDIAPKFYPTHHQHIIHAFTKIDLTQHNSRNSVEAEFATFVPNAAERQFLMKNLGRNNAGQFEWKINVAVLAREIYQIGGELQDVQTISIPALFLRGGNSSYVESEDEPNIKAIFPKAIIQTIENAGHWVQAEQPEAFVQAFLAFAAS